MLENILNDYVKAELTCLFLHDRKLNKAWNIVTLIELIPEEQVDSPKFCMEGEAKKYYHIPQKMEKFKDNIFYVKRCLSLSIEEAITIYKNAPKSFDLPYEESSNLNITFYSKELTQEPPNYNPILVPNERNTYRDILPYRKTSFRVWSKLDIHKDKTWLNKFDPKYRNEFLSTLGEFSKKYIGCDLSTNREHIGNIYLFGSNPLLREVKISLLDGEKKLYFQFLERCRKSIIGGNIEIVEERGENIGLNIKQVIKSCQEIVELAYRPNKLLISIYSSKGELLEYMDSVFLEQISFNVEIVSTQLNLTIQGKNKEEVLHIPKKVGDKTVIIGNNTNVLPSFYLKNAYDSREYIRKKADFNFIFFPPQESSREEAKGVIRLLINKARKKCMILDPYFSSRDIINYIWTIENISVPIKIITSEAFLTNPLSDIAPNTAKKLTVFQRILKCFFPDKKKAKQKLFEAHLLYTELSKFRQFSISNPIECKVLKGRKKSPLHDRYIIIDDKVVYFLGSSLNEFGRRATALIKIDTPEEVIEQANKWWNGSDKDKCIDLETYINQIEKG